MGARSSQPKGAQPVLPHKGLDLVLSEADGLWGLEGSLPYPLPRSMHVFRLRSGKLWVISPVALSDYEPLDALGPVGVIVVPNGYHRLDALTYKQRYPDAVVWLFASARNRGSCTGRHAHSLFSLPLVSYNQRVVYSLRWPVYCAAHQTHAMFGGWFDGYSSCCFWGSSVLFVCLVCFTPCALLPPLSR